MIIITGDSWGVGEWNKSCNLNGPGIGQLLMLHTTDGVINLSQGNFSNTQIANRLENFLQRWSANDADTVYWIVTCPSRCVDVNYYIDTKDGILENSYKILHKSLEKMNSIAEQHNIRIKLIGGLCDLNSIDIKNYSKLEIVVPSWGELLDSSYQTFVLTPNYMVEFGKLIKEKRSELLPEWLDVSNQITKKYQSWKKLSTTYFSTDGNHPDRFGHRVLRDYLYPEFSQIL